jgi:hypothetical protein
MSFSNWLPHKSTLNPRTAQNYSMYDTLPAGRHIRLLEIEENDTGNEISCKLKATCLDEKPSFLALSYVWGDPEKTQTITCNGQQLQVTTNLVAALKQLRVQFPASSHFWIDAISINQADLAERSSQVQIMQDIYRSATQVVVYLGEDTEGLDRAMDLFKAMDEKAKEPLSNNNRPSLIRGSLPKSHEEIWDRIHDFFKRPWFSRIWIVQEVASSTHDPIVLCGPFVLQWSSVARVARFMTETALALATGRRGRVGNVLMIEQHRDFKPWLGFLLQSSFHFESTDPRDMVFALHGLVDPKFTAELRSDYFLVDYQKSVKEVFRDAMIGHIKYSATIEPMCKAIASESSAKYDLPSWVPNWATPLAERKPGFATFSGLAGYKVAGGQLAMTTTTSDPDVLRIGGRLAGTVAWIAEPFTKADLGVLRHLRRPRTLEKLWEHVSGMLGSSPEVCESFWRTLIANTTREHRPASEELFSTFVGYWNATKRYDLLAEEYYKAHSGPIPFDDEIGMQTLFAEAAKEEANYPISPEEFDSIKRYTSLLAQQFSHNHEGPADPNLEARMKELLSSQPDARPELLDWKDGECARCILEAVPHGRVQAGLMRVAQCPGPSHNFKDRDPSIKEHFRLLAEDDLYCGVDYLTECHGHLKNSLPGLCFLITTNGSMGLGPKSAKVGDRVVILSGSGTPFILRSTGVASLLMDQTRENCYVPRLITKYNVIGDAYIHGIMNGEAVEGFDWQRDYDVFDLV